jgi:23S rRNA pseudouridine2605 synthase
MTERLQKILSQWGVASRRQAEQMILDGRVRLNGVIVHLGQKADPEHDQITVDDILIQPTNRPQTIYLLINKPLGIVSSCSDPWNHKTVLDLLPSPLRTHHGIHPVGRLDTNSTGALLLTNNGAVTFALTHPSHAIPKTYQVWVQGRPSETVLEQWRRGIVLSERLTLPAEVNVLNVQSQSKTLLEVVLREGRNRQIRRVAEQLGYPVIHLHRVSIGSICLHRLPVGHYRPLNPTEIQFLETQVAAMQQALAQ